MIVYAGAILVLFLFAVMMLNVAPGGRLLGRGLDDAGPVDRPGPAQHAAAGGTGLRDGRSRRPGRQSRHGRGPRAVGLALFSGYLLGVELAAMLLLSALVGAYHLGRRQRATSLGGPWPGEVVGQRTSARIAGGEAGCEEVIARRAATGIAATGPRRRRPVRRSPEALNMISVPLESALTLAAILFALGLAGLVVVRRNILFVLMSIEIMLNAAGLAMVAAGARWQQPDGQIMFLFMLTMARGRGGGGPGPDAGRLRATGNARQRRGQPHARLTCSNSCG